MNEIADGARGAAEADAMRRFAALSERWCALAEGQPDEPLVEMRAAYRMLLELQQAASCLPVGEPGGDAERASHDRWSTVHRRFGALSFQFYSAPVDPFDTDGAAGIADLSDDLADLWRGLRDGLDLYRSGEVDAAVFTWRFGFRTHWGRHAARAAHALHCALADNDALFDARADARADAREDP